MWVKRYADGKQIYEEPEKERTWLKTPLDGITEVFLVNGSSRSMGLSGYTSYWHSRTAVAMQDGTKYDLIERIQALRDDGKWDTVEWDGARYRYLILDQAIGKPVIK